MALTWILVADRSGAHIWQTRGRNLDHVKEIAHPEGRLHDGELESDAAGRSFASHGKGSDAMEKSESPSETVAKRFAKELADVARDARAKGAFERLFLVAEPFMPLYQLLTLVNGSQSALRGAGGLRLEDELIGHFRQLAELGLLFVDVCRHREHDLLDLGAGRHCLVAERLRVHRHLPPAIDHMADRQDFLLDNAAAAFLSRQVGAR